jgi:hypothetical protein
MESKHVIPTRVELLAELANELIEPDIPEGAITVRMLIDECGRSEDVCRALLDRRVKEGKMDVVMISHVKYYWQVNK